MAPQSYLADSDRNFGANQLRKSHRLTVNIIEAVGVTKSFFIGPLHVDAVRGIDLAVRKGELLAIVGPSASGKSTLLNLLGAIETPTPGHVLLEAPIWRRSTTPNGH